MSTVYFLIFNFIFYSFLGYLIEQVYAYFSRGHFKTEGFLYGPFKPMYGFSMAILIFLRYALRLGPWSMLVLCLIIPTVIEYISGFLTHTFFHILYWDYSSIKLNYKGLVCLPFSIAWMGLCFLGIYYFQPFLNTFYLYNIALWPSVLWPLMLYLLFDFLLTLKRLGAFLT